MENFNVLDDCLKPDNCELGHIAGLEHFTRCMEVPTTGFPARAAETLPLILDLLRRNEDNLVYELCIRAVVAWSSCA